MLPAGWAAPGDDSALPAPPEATAAPHSLQKRAPAGSLALHDRQLGALNDAPQALQNLPRALAPQAGQTLVELFEEVTMVRMMDVGVVVQ